MHRNTAIKFIFLCMLLLAQNLSYAKTDDEETNIPIQIGNFSMPLALQPGPLVSFGENILGKGRIQLSLNTASYIGRDNFYTYIQPALLYGITDDFSVMAGIPIAPRNQEGANHSAGFQDLFLQFEYAYVNYNTKTSNDLATIVGNISFPTGSYSVDPPLGLGSYSFFLGGTYNHTGIEWFVFLSSGILLTTNWTGHNLSGNQFFYEFGFGRTIMSSPKWIFAWVVEFDGIYTKDTHKTKGSTTGVSVNTQALDSGGNVIYLTPSLSFTFEPCLFQFGVGYPIVQNVHEGQPRQFLSVNAAFVFTFN